MITNFLMDHSALVPVTLVLIALVCAGVGYLFLRSRKVMWTLATLSVLPVFALTLVPTSGRAYETCAVQFSLPSLGTVELLANVALFFPPVFFAALATRRPLLMLVAGTGLSAALEALQALVPAIGRSCDTNDWMMNTIGAVAGTLVAWGTIALNAKRPRRPRP
jgi:glycopeptide antibiotics resistance protein